MTQLRISSYNVRGINGENKRRDIFEYLKTTSNNIYCIQDIHCSCTQEATFRKDWDGDMIISTGTNNSRGVAILFKKNFEYDIKEIKNDLNGNFVALKIRMFETDVCLISLYGPNTDDPNFYDQIIELIDEFQTPTIILCGDWNLVQNQTIDTKYYLRENNTRARAKVESLKQQYDLVDPWRINNPDKRQYTWFQRNPIKMSRLDYFLVSADIMALTSRADIKPGYRSDHSIITLQLNISNDSRGKGFWKFNTSLLHDPNYLDLIKQIIKENIDRYSNGTQDPDNHEIEFNINDQLFFETLKMEIRKVTIPFSSKKKREREKQEINIMTQIQEKEGSNPATLNQEDLGIIQTLKDELYSIRKDKIKGMILRSKVQWLEEGEKPTNFFANLEKKNYVNKLINKLDIDGNIIQNQPKILQETENFYQNLYKSRISQVEQHNNLNTFLNGRWINELNENQKQSCEGNITLDEIKIAIKEMKHDKSPGIDGFPVEFYKVFWKDLGQFLVRSIQSSFVTGELSITQKRGIITCIPKGDKPREFLKNWRPISLLTTDYKIITSVLANRMRTVLNKIINPNQKGFLKDRYIEENTRLIYDLIQYCKENNKEGLLLLIDFEKAFDSIEWSYLRKVLRAYNFGEEYIKWFKIVYNGAQSCVINNGNYSSFFNLGRGCRQGDPWSPYLFILAIEPLAQCIMNTPHITGIKMGNKEIKIGQYADDTFLTLDGSQTSTTGVMKILKLFEQVSGLKINVNKTQVIKLGKTSKNTNCPVLNLPYCKIFKLLGINFSTNLEEMDEINFRIKIAHMHKIVKLYQWRNLSMTGRITIVKMHILPTLVHLLAVLPTPKPQFIKEINTILSQFIWNYKSPKIQLNTLVQDFKQGGQKMLHFNSFCKSSKLSWINKIYTTSNSNSWKIMVQELLKEKHISFVFEGSIDRIKCIAKKVKNKFWKEVLETWIFYRENIDITQNEQIPNTVIWNSNFIRNDNLIARRNTYISKGLVYFKDMFDYERKEFRSRVNIRETFNIDITQFDYICLMQSIPSIIKNMIKLYTPQTQGNNYGKLISDICSRKKTCNYTYNRIIKHLHFEVKCKSKWEEKLSMNINNEEWQNIFTLTKTLTLDSQLRIFQYKIIHRTLPTNRLLHIYKIRDNPWCDNCENIIETLVHFFHLCPKKLQIWYDIAHWIFPEVDMFPYINSENLLLGVYNENRILENYIILLIKRYLYVNKCFDREINIVGAKQYLKYMMILETNVRNSKYKAQALHKWEPIKSKIMSVN